jgi:predicted outer membrane lipoprotein
MKVMLDPAAPDHWKFRKLAELLYAKQKVAKSCALAAAFGHVNALWCRTMTRTDEGRLVKWTADMVATAALWSGNPKKFVHALLKVGFLDMDPDGRTYVVHDWHEHQGDIIAERIYERDRKREQRRRAAEKRRQEAEEAARKALEAGQLELEPSKAPEGSTAGGRRASTGDSPGKRGDSPGFHRVSDGTKPQIPASSTGGHGLTHAVPRDKRDGPAVPFPSPSPTLPKREEERPPRDISGTEQEPKGGQAPDPQGSDGAGSGSRSTSPPSEAPARTGEKLESEELAITLAAFQRFKMPGPEAKQSALEDLRRQGVSHQWLRAAARANPRSDFFAIMKALRNGRTVQPAEPASKKPTGPPCPRCKGIGNVEADEFLPGEDQKRWGKCPACKGTGVQAVAT